MATLSNWVYESDKAKRGASGASRDLVDENRQLAQGERAARNGVKRSYNDFRTDWVKETGES